MDPSTFDLGGAWSCLGGGTQPGCDAQTLPAKVLQSAGLPFA